MERIQGGADQIWQGRNHSKLVKFASTVGAPILGALRPVTHSSQNLGVNFESVLAAERYHVKRVEQVRTGEEPKYLIKHNDNKLKFIVNLIGDNLSNTYLDSRGDDLRLNKNNINELFLVQYSQPIELPSLELTQPGRAI